MVRFLLVTICLAVALPSILQLGFRYDWIPAVPSFLHETTWLVACFTTVIFVYLYRSNKTGYFVQLYLLSMAVKLLACFAYNLIIIASHPAGAVMNVLYFLSVYSLFTAVEIGFLYRRISGQ